MRPRERMAAALEGRTPDRCAVILALVLGPLAPAGSPARAEDTLPAYCGVVGAQRFPQPIDVPFPVITLQRGTAVTVSTDSDAMNGAVSSVRALIANPGPDGISLREAITATNNDPAIYTIRFAPQLAGKTINIGSWDGTALPALTGGNVTINGDTNGDGKPDIVLNGTPVGDNGLFIASTDNTIHAIAIRNFFNGVNGRPRSPHSTFANTVISNLVIQDVRFGIHLETKVQGNTADLTSNRLTGTLIVGNVVDVQESAIILKSFWAAGNTIDRATIVNNALRTKGDGYPAGILLNAGYFCGSDNNRVTDSLIAHNTIEYVQGGILGPGSGRHGIHLLVGGAGGSGNVLDGVRIIGNRSRGADAGIFLALADAGSDWERPDLRPVCYPQKNEIRNVWILNNSVESSHDAGIKVSAGWGGARQNSISDVFVLGNTLSDIGIPRVPRRSYYGVLVEGGTDVGIAEQNPATANEISGVVVQGNTVLMSPIDSRPYSGGVGLVGGSSGATGNVVKDIWVSHNDVDGGGGPGVNVVGGYGRVGSSVPQANVVSRAEIWCNRVAGNPADAYLRGSGVKGVSVIGGTSGARNNRVEQVRIEGNLVGGMLNDYSAFPNFLYFETETSGNTINTTDAVGIANVPWARANSVANGASFESKPVAPGSLSTLFGTNLAAARVRAEAVPLPTLLGGVTVRLNGVAVPLTYISPLQINFQVPWELSGQREALLTVSAEGITGTARAVSLADYGPGLFATTGSQGAILNAEGRLVDRSTPARAGDVIQIFATGLGPVTRRPATGEPAPVDVLATTLATPSATIGGVSAPVLFSGLAPGFVGLYQVNVRVPEGASAGDDIPVVLTAGGVASNSVTIAVR